MRFWRPVFQSQNKTSEGQSKLSENSISPSPQPWGENLAAVIRPKIDEVEGLQFLPPSCVSSSMARWGHSRRLAASCGSIQSGNCWPRRRGGRLQPPIIPTSLFTNSIQTKRVYSGLDSTFSAAETLTQSAPPFFDS